MTSVHDVVIESIARVLKRARSDVAPGMTLDVDLGADSIAVVEIIMRVEERLGITLPDEILPSLTTVADVVSETARQQRLASRPQLRKARAV